MEPFDCVSVRIEPIENLEVWSNMGLQEFYGVARRETYRYHMYVSPSCVEVLLVNLDLGAGTRREVYMKIQHSERREQLAIMTKYGQLRASINHFRTNSSSTVAEGHRVMREFLTRYGRPTQRGYASNGVMAALPSDTRDYTGHLNYNHYNSGYPGPLLDQLMGIPSSKASGGDSTPPQKKYKELEERHFKTETIKLNQDDWK